MNLADLQAAYRAGHAVVTPDEAEPWKIAKCSRASWYRFMNSPEAPTGLVLRLGHLRRLSLPVLLHWLGVDERQSNVRP